MFLPTNVFFPIQRMIPATIDFDKKLKDLP